MDDLSNAVKTSGVACYADDTKIFKSIDSITDCNALQSDLNNLVSWLESSGLIFNQSKCKYQCISRKKSLVQPTYTINETPLEACDTEKDLGVWVSSNLTSDKQVSEQCAKAKTPRVCAPTFSVHPKRPNASYTVPFYRPVPSRLCNPSMVATVHWPTKAS